MLLYISVGSGQPGECTGLMLISIVFSSTVIDHVMEHVVHSLIVEETQLY